MADVVEDVVTQVKDFLTDAPVNGTRKTPATPEGMAMAYTSLVVMAVLPIFFGALRSVRYRKVQMVRMVGGDSFGHVCACGKVIVLSSLLYFCLDLFYTLFVYC